MVIVLPILKYPRTPHVVGSRLQVGDDDLEQVPFDALRGLELVVEEKVDGANCGISFDDNGTLLLQSRGHYLEGGGREAQFALFKQWATCHQAALWSVLGVRFILYGEWLYAKHTVFYDHLPHYFLEFDVWDREEECFLSTARRHRLLAPLPIVSVPVIATGRFEHLDQLLTLITTSRYKSAGWRDVLCEHAKAHKQNHEQLLQETDPTDTMEGLYIKRETDGVVERRYKYLRDNFRTNITSTTQWHQRTILPNILRGGVEIFAQQA